MRPRCSPEGFPVVKWNLNTAVKKVERGGDGERGKGKCESRGGWMNFDGLDNVVMMGRRDALF